MRQVWCEYAIRVAQRQAQSVFGRLSRALASSLLQTSSEVDREKERALWLSRVIENESQRSRLVVVKER